MNLIWRQTGLILKCLKSFCKPGQCANMHQLLSKKIAQKSVTNYKLVNRGDVQQSRLTPPLYINNDTSNAILCFECHTTMLMQPWWTLPQLNNFAQTFFEALGISAELISTSVFYPRPACPWIKVVPYTRFIFHIYVFVHCSRYITCRNMRNTV